VVVGRHFAINHIIKLLSAQFADISSALMCRQSSQHCLHLQLGLLLLVQLFSCPSTVGRQTLNRWNNLFTVKPRSRHIGHISVVSWALFDHWKRPASIQSADLGYNVESMRSAFPWDRLQWYRRQTSAVSVLSAGLTKPFQQRFNLRSNIVHQRTKRHISHISGER